MTATTEFQLQLWNGREYVTAETVTCAPHRASEAFERYAGARRIVRTDKQRDTRPRYVTSRQWLRPTASQSRTRQEVIAQYMVWAEAKGLARVTAYRDTWLATHLPIHRVDRAEFLGPAPAPETDVELALAA